MPSIEQSPKQGQPWSWREKLCDRSHGMTRPADSRGDSPSTSPGLGSPNSSSARQSEFASPAMTNQSTKLRSSPTKTESQDDVLNRNLSPTTSTQVLEQLRNFVAEQPRGKASIRRIKRYIQQERLESTGFIEVDEYEHIVGIMNNLVANLSKKKFCRVIEHMGLEQYFRLPPKLGGYAAPRPGYEELPEPGGRAFTEPPSRGKFEYRGNKLKAYDQSGKKVANEVSPQQLPSQSHKNYLPPQRNNHSPLSNPAESTEASVFHQASRGVDEKVPTIFPYHFH